MGDGVWCGGDGKGGEVRERSGFGVNDDGEVGVVGGVSE